MFIEKLMIERVRNISKLEIRPHQRCNIIVGDNGSGKSSILEAIHFLGFGRTFRKSKISEVIQFEQKDLVVFSSSQNAGADKVQKNFGIKKSKSGDNEIRIGGVKAKRLSQLSSQFPIISFTPDSIDLIEAGPSIRRKFIDWLVFHVKQSELVAQTYRDFDKVLEQRNHALRLGDRKQIHAWTSQFIELNLQIQSYRAEIIGLLNHEFQNSYIQVESSKFNFNPELIYKLGWNSELELKDILARNLETEIKRKTTCFGVHRDDLILELNSVSVKNILSRGECKRYVLAMLLAAENVISKNTDKNCIWLLDDIAAELDFESIKNAFSICNNVGNQMFFTCIEKDLELIKQVTNFGYSVFHVKHGELLN
ncbi:DNA replication/repair protein RecF [Catenovulum maritimum]|uniref:DNA replication and repair protein RecF n=1 Tax=Catenovulum maritimum TaxID=1513271 RepID=A0A0J8GXJ0_9ALTE|nr:DNA replication and repair protein RecF [Catenovulum maritimum]KMT65969.1 hypothetical protein XM47_05800 [Catenovulum maritimum]